MNSFVSWHEVSTHVSRLMSHALASSLAIALSLPLAAAEVHVTLSDKPTPASTDPNNWWQKAAAYRDNQAKELADADVVWLGDSITHYFDNSGPKNDLWKKYFGGPKCGAPYLGLNFGIEGDTTDNLLWRIGKSLAKTHPKAIIINIGTNNAGKRSEKTETPDDTIKGLEKVIEEVRRIEPQATIFVYALFPRGKGVTDPCMIRNEKVNAGLEKLCDGRHAIWCDIRKKFLLPDGTVDATLLEDRLHPAPKGYEVWLADVLPRLEKLMGKPKRCSSSFIDRSKLTPAEIASLDAAIAERKELAEKKFWSKEFEKESVEISRLAASADNDAAHHDAELAAQNLPSLERAAKIEAQASKECARVRELVAFCQAFVKKIVEVGPNGDIDRAIEERLSDFGLGYVKDLIEYERPDQLLPLRDAIIGAMGAK